MSLPKQCVFYGALEPEQQQEIQVYVRQELVRWLWSVESEVGPEHLRERNAALAKRDWRAQPDQLEPFLTFIQNTIQSADDDGLVIHALMSTETLNLSANAFLLIPGTSQKRKVVVIDSGAPDAIEDKKQELDFRRTLFVVSSKSEYGVREHCLFLYFRRKVEEVAGAEASKHFISETEPDTYLASLSRGYAFRELRPDVSEMPAGYCSLMQFAALLTATGSAKFSEIVAGTGAIRDACANGNTAENPALQLAAFLSSAIRHGRRYLMLIASPSLMLYTCRLAHLVGGSLARGDSPLIPLFGVVPRVIAPVAQDGIFAVLSYAGDQDPGIEKFMEDLRARKQPFVHLTMDKPMDLLTETFKWEAATILTCARLGTDPFDVRDGRMPRAFVQEMLEQLARRENPLQRSRRITDKLIQLYADGVTRQEISSLSVSEALQTFLRLATRARHISLLVHITRSEEVHDKFVALREMLTNQLQRPVFMAFGPYGGQYFEYFFRESLPFGPCILFTSDTVNDIDIPGAEYTFGQLHQVMSLSEYDTLGQWRRPVIRLHLSREFPAALEQLLQVFEQALHRMQR